MGVLIRPPHLPLLHETFCHHLIHSRFDVSAGDRIAMPEAVAVIDDEALVVIDVGETLLKFRRQLGLRFPIWL